VPLQNRVTPFGEIVAVTARGAVMGNRGRLHDTSRRIVRTVAGGYAAWVICRLEFKGRRRAVMTPGRYTELFFLDEATALAAGHRPCGECRRPDHVRFKAAWFAGNPDRKLASTTISAIDRELHRDRLTDRAPPRASHPAPPRGQRTFPAELETLPDGAFVRRSRSPAAFLVWREGLFAWTPDGYAHREARPAGEVVEVLTPRSTVRALACGYIASVHPSAGGE
jgi:hypothetical protein